MIKRNIILIIFLFISECIIQSFPSTTSISKPDVWENQTVAVNFAKYNTFPVMGVIEDDQKKIYQLDKLQENEIENYTKCRFLSSGFVVDFFKPPVYALFLGISYKIWGIEMKIAYYLNSVFLLLIVFFIIKSAELLNSRKGIWIGVGLAVVYIYIGEHGLYNILPENLVTLLFLIAIYLALLILKENKTVYYFLLGIVVGLGILTKGTMLILAFFIFLAIVVSQYKKRGIKPKLFILFSALLIIFTPWIIYANVLRLNQAEKMFEWQEKVVLTEKECTELVVSGEWGKSGVGFSADSHHEELVTNLLKRYVTPHSFVIISNQTPVEGLLELHNEYCVDGLWHPEWKYKEAAVYNHNYLQLSPINKVIRFYIDNPKYIYKNAIGKLSNATKPTNYIFIISSFLIGCLSLSIRMKNINHYLRCFIFLVLFLIFMLSKIISFDLHLLFAVFIFLMGLIGNKKIGEILLVLLTISGVFVMLFLFHGAPRFINFTTPIMLIFATWTVGELILEMKKKKVHGAE